MDITGLVVAASEGIQLENGKGLLYKIYNQTENIHIFLLACGSVHYWANIFVNRYYNFTGLRAGIFESLSGSRKFLLKTSPNSNYLEIQQQQVKKLKMSSKLKRIISVPDVKALYNSEMNFRSKLISYQGTITDVKVPGFGIYELDNKIKLYATLNAFRSSLNSLSVGAQVLVSNIHLLSISKDEKILVCCGLSSIKKMNFQDLSEKKEGLISDLKYPPRCNLSIYDILWLEELFSRLNSKFSVDIVAGDSSFLYTTEFFYNILEYFCSPVADMLSIRLSLAEEFCSHPHKCSAFSEDTLSTGYVIPYISEILDEAALRISWEEHSKNWRTSSVCNISGSLLIGMLYVAEDGNFHVVDKSYCMQIVFTGSCVRCREAKDILCGFGEKNIAFLTAFQKFDVLFEEIFCKNGLLKKYQYLKTQSCRLYPLATFFKSGNHFYPIEPSINSLYTNYLFKTNYNVIKAVDSIDSVNEISGKRTLKTYERSLSYDNAESNYQRFLILSALWTVNYNYDMCCEFFALFMPSGNSCSSFAYETKSSEDNFQDFYDVDDDFEFADLVNKMDSLLITNKRKLSKLSFETSKNSLYLMPGHIYQMNFMRNCSRGNDVHAPNVYKSNMHDVISIKISSSEQIIHDTECLGYHIDEEIEYYSINDVFSKRNLTNYCIVKAIIIDKFFEEKYTKLHHGHSQLTLKTTLCLKLADSFYENPIHAYVPYHHNILGLLPGVKVKLYGFLCCCSKKGFLYLRASTMFGIQVENSGTLTEITTSFDSSNWNQMKSISNGEIIIMDLLGKVVLDGAFRCLCFILKIISAEIILSCAKCSRNSRENCTCWAPYVLKTRYAY
ncbi:uncharacterized protein LOC118191291 isoform X2 [Stegodyphus dumicola]|uniref:uncharacterized protein LOC118191291 isoform X2 n=1 Tax=Stegodyphus dumicola TaxID=202533 RepID=UPI0015B0BB58|nr:uncharacterized protein LOC118191291 isoform X2 [Stegodyphus dumicola]